MADVHADMVRAKERTEAELLKRPGVTGVDIGFKEVNGEKTNTVAIRVLVEKKRDVAAKDRIPETIDGYPTDVIERKFELQVVSTPFDSIALEADTGRYTPLKGGVSLGPTRVVGGFVFVGTLGAIVKDNATGNPMMLSNFHVLCIDSTFHTGDQQAQPGLVDGGHAPADVVGSLQRQSLGGSVDCAVADIAPGRGTTCEIMDIGAVTGTATATLGQSVRKRGRTTGLTYGTIDSVNLSVNIDYGPGLGVKTLTHQIGIKPDVAHNAKFGDHGDSGSVVVNDKVEVLGLHFAGDPTGYAIANPIADVLSALDVSLCTSVAKAPFKDFKDHKLEGKELKIEKFEHKEHKFEKNEGKELKIEKVEHKERKFEKNEIKELKHEKFEHKELEKTHLEKGLKEQIEGPEFPGNPGDPGPIADAGSGLKKIEFKEFSKDVGKESTKEFFKHEHKDHKEKPEKHEIKDHKEKPEKHEIKEIKEKHEKIEHKEFAKFEHGEKQVGKEKDGKELKEAAFEGPGGWPGGPGDPGPIVQQQVAALEQAIAQLRHFITAAQRPDLSHGALTGEPDLAARSAELAQQASAAKSAKDAKDAEKLSDR